MEGFQIPYTEKGWKALLSLFEIKLYWSPMRI